MTASCSRLLAGYRSRLTAEHKAHLMDLLHRYWQLTYATAAGFRQLEKRRKPTATGVGVRPAHSAGSRLSHPSYGVSGRSFDSVSTPSESIGG